MSIGICNPTGEVSLAQMFQAFADHLRSNLSCNDDRLVEHMGDGMKLDEYLQSQSGYVCEHMEMV